jgi:hypothetical protein
MSAVRPDRCGSFSRHSFSRQRRNRNGTAHDASFGPILSALDTPILSRSSIGNDYAISDNLLCKLPRGSPKSKYTQARPVCSQFNGGLFVQALPQLLTLLATILMVCEHTTDCVCVVHLA